jgi:GLPGLI family protein
MRKIEWKYTSDIRKIAGFNCRKATGIIMDSVFVFAFFTEEIMVTGGPEGFNGLPGMILGVAIPRMHITWFATKLELVDVSAKDLAAPVKGKKTTIAELQKSLQGSLKDWGKWAERNIWQIML